mmetsp:Transcript_44209/g.96170  ORF Transcript_44209/g.96170 Transcript_44209/m.96170 type:complete len:305 (-) Transcript_44209:39-953(-)
MPTLDADYQTIPSIFTPGKRKRINYLPVILNIIVPWAIFALVLYLVSFDFHYKHPMGTIGLIVALLSLCIIIALVAKSSRGRDKEPSWLTFFALTTFIAVLAAAIIGFINFYDNMVPFYEANSLNVYPAVNPSSQQGVEVMDGGRVYFTTGSRVDRHMGMAFKNDETYCVAPIVVFNSTSNLPMEPKTKSYDFWAIGMNCCDRQGNFRCGSYANPKARSGLRLMTEEERPNYRLAVQQAEATYSITSIHPVFFTWVQDPVDEINKWLVSGRELFWKSVWFYCLANAFFVIVLTVGFTKLGRYNW